MRAAYIILLTISCAQFAFFYWQYHIRNLYPPINNLFCVILSFYLQYEASSLHHFTDNLMHVVCILLLAVPYTHFVSSY